MKHSFAIFRKRCLFATLALIGLLSAADANAQFTAKEVLHHIGVAIKYPNIAYESQPDFTQMTSAQEYFDATWSELEAKRFSDGSYYIVFDYQDIQPFGNAHYQLRAVTFSTPFRYIHCQRHLDSKAEMEAHYNLTINELKRAGGVLLGPDKDMGIDQQITFPEAYPNIVIRLQKSSTVVYLDIQIRVE